MKFSTFLSATALAISANSALAADLYATAAPDTLLGTPGDDNIIVNRRSFIPGDTYNGNAGVDTLWVTKTMTGIDFPADNFNFSTATLRNLEVLAFNYMLMEMPGQAIFSSSQFGPGLMSNNLAIYGAWGNQDITVNLTPGNSSFNASGWVFKTDLITYGAVWGPYVYPGLGEVGGVDTIHINGSTGNNNIVGTSQDDIISGNAGDDNIEGGTGKNRIDGGPGSDTASYTRARSRVAVNLALAGPQNTLGAGVDTLLQIENLVGSAFNDTLVGNAGANIIEGGPGNDSINGAAGSDTASYENASSRVVVNLALTSAQNTIGAGTDTLLQIENLRGSRFNDTLIGNNGPNVIEGGPGNDSINGGAGFDTASYEHANARVVVNLSIAGAQNTIGAGVDTLTSIENLIGSSFNDTLIGNGGPNVIEGGPGNDSINGGAGIDTVSYLHATARVVVNLSIAGAQNTQGAGVDTLTAIENIVGTPFDDILTGNNLANVIEGGAGKDIVRGGLGRDTFVFARLTDMSVGPNRDVIVDFTSGVDRIDLWRVDANTSQPGDQSFTYIGASGFSGTPGQLRFSGGILSGDVDGNRTADFEIALTGVSTLNPATDFIY